MEDVKIIRKQGFGVVTDKNDPNFGRTRTSVLSRAMGYIRPVDNFNIGKRAEFEERKTFTEANSLKKLKKNRKTDNIK